MNEANFTENSYEQAIIALFQEMGYRHECGYESIFTMTTLTVDS